MSYMSTSGRLSLPTPPAPVRADDPAEESAEEDPVPDGVLLAQVRAGDRSAFDELYRRHHRAVLRAAASICGPNLAEDHTAEAFQRVLSLLISGKGPDQYVRAYLTTAVRNIHLNHLRQSAKVDLHQEPLEETRPDAPGDPWHDRFSSQAVTDAFSSLPTRWQQVLWLQTVEGRSVPEISEIMGLRPGAVSQLSYRARQALRTAYLDTHLQQPTSTQCQSVQTRLLRSARTDRRSRPYDTETADHLRGCADCTSRFHELRRVVVELGHTGPDWDAEAKRLLDSLSPIH